MELNSRLNAAFAAMELRNTRRIFPNIRKAFADRQAWMHCTAQQMCLVRSCYFGVVMLMMSMMTMTEFSLLIDIRNRPRKTCHQWISSANKMEGRIIPLSVLHARYG